MKIRNQTLIKTLGLVSSWVVRLWMGTLRYRFRYLGSSVDPLRRDLKSRVIYAFWHENMLLPAYSYGRTRAWVLISQHADGQLIAEVCRHLRLRLVRGSSTRGGIEAVRQLLRVGREAPLVITPDGPRGPRRRVQAGLIYLAARSGLAIVPTGVGYRRPWRLGSWDRFAVPRPWSLGTCITAEPIRVPADADRELLERYRLLVEQELHQVTEMAERWAAGERRP